MKNQSTAVILSAPMLLEEGTFCSKFLSLEEAQCWVQNNDPINFSGHITVKAVGLEPAISRDQCTGFDQALILKPLGRLEFGKEYSLEEVLEIGVQPMLIYKIDIDQIIRAEQGYM
jgi:hypothetical protein